MKITTNVPISAEIYRHLRAGSGLFPKTAEAAEKGLAHSLFTVLVSDDQGNAIGMGRVIGDGGCFCQVVDICVLPRYQGQGIGKKIMAEISRFIETLPESCYISLLADGKADQLYSQFGFRDTLPHSRGMYLLKQ